MAVPKPMQTEFGIHHRLESCEGILLNQCLLNRLTTVLTLSGILVLLTFGVTFGTAVVDIGLSEVATGVSDTSSSSGLENLHKNSQFWALFLLNGFIY